MDLKQFFHPKLHRFQLTHHICSLFIAGAMLAFPLSSTTYAYDAYGTQEDIKSIEVTQNNRKVTFYDLYNGQVTDRPDTSDPARFYMDVVTANDTYLKWLNLAYLIHKSEPLSYWDHANKGWDKDFGGHYIDYINDMLNARSTGGDDRMTSSGLSYANSLEEIKSRMCNDIYSCIHKKLTPQDFSDHHDFGDTLDDSKSGPIIYSTVSCVDRYGKTYQYGYNSFAIVFYDFQLHPIDTGEAFNTVTDNMTLDEAKENPPAGFSYKETVADETVIVSSRNESFEPVTESINISDSTTETLSTSITDSESYSFGECIGVGTSITEKFGAGSSTAATFSLSIETSFEQAMSTAYSEEKSVSKTIEKSSTADCTIPAHTILEATKNIGTTQMMTTYDCPIGVTYKVAILSMCGCCYDDNAATHTFSTAGYDQRSFITIFGSDADGSDAIENLYLRGDKYASNSSYDATFGTTYSTKRDGRQWTNCVKWNSILSSSKPKTSASGSIVGGSEVVKQLESSYPMSLTGASTTMESAITKTTVGSAIPLYPLKTIAVAYQLDPNIKLTVGDTFPIHSYRVIGKDKDACDFYGFVSTWGEWKIVDETGKEIDSPIAQMRNDPVTHKQEIIALSPGSVYVKYFIDEDKYYYYNETSPNKQAGPVTNDMITSPAYQVIITEQAKPAFNGTIELKGDVTAYVNDEAINLNSIDTLEAHAYDPTGKEVELMASWEAQELPTSGISVSDDGVLSVTKPGTFHVRAYWDTIYSNWIEVNAIEKPNHLIINSTLTPTEEKITTNQSEEISLDNDTIMTKSEFIDLLHQLADQPEVPMNELFDDVTLDALHATALNWAKSKGYITGDENNRFNPNESLTIEQLALFIYNIAQRHGLAIEMSEEEVATTLSQYVEGGEIAQWARYALAYALNNGYISTSNGTINPADYVQRWQAAQAMTDIAIDTGIMEESEQSMLDEATIQELIDQEAVGEDTEEEASEDTENTEEVIETITEDETLELETTEESTNDTIYDLEEA